MVYIGINEGANNLPPPPKKNLIRGPEFLFGPLNQYPQPRIFLSRDFFLDPSISLLAKKCPQRIIYRRCENKKKYTLKITSNIF